MGEGRDGFSKFLPGSNITKNKDNNNNNTLKKKKKKKFGDKLQKWMIHGRLSANVCFFVRTEQFSNGREIWRLKKFLRKKNLRLLLINSKTEFGFTTNEKGNRKKEEKTLGSFSEKKKKLTILFSVFFFNKLISTENGMRLEGKGEIFGG